MTTESVTIYERALEFIEENSVVGLGSGRASMEFVKRLGVRVQAGLRMRGVPTSQPTADLAKQLGIPLMSLEEGIPLDLTVDGADEVDPTLNLIKGYGRAFVREKIVAAASRQLVILVGEEKLVPVLGKRKKLPVEVVPFALPLSCRRLEEIGCKPIPYTVDGNLFVTENGNNIVDCVVSDIEKPSELEDTIGAIPGVVDTGLFLGMAHTVLVGDRNGFQLKEEVSR